MPVGKKPKKRKKPISGRGEFKGRKVVYHKLPGGGEEGRFVKSPKFKPTKRVSKVKINSTNTKKRGKPKKKRV